MKLFKTSPKKTKAQAMVEFAIVLPLLLVLLYGLLEAGRLLFIYSTIVTASRQAVRYGSATGVGIGTTVPRYQDCAGIRLAAQKVDFLRAFDDADIQIQYDTGPGSTPTTYCAGPVDTSFIPSSANTNRLLVTVDGDYLPILPKLIPFAKRSQDNTPPNPIVAKSARTILVSVAIVVTVPPSTYQPSTPTATATVNTPTFTPTNTPTNTATNTPIYTETPSLTPTLTLTPTNTLTPTITNTPSLTPTASMTPTQVIGCINIGQSGLGPITLSGNTMTMTIKNSQAYNVAIQNIFVVWNNDKGHQVGNDKSLVLQSVTLTTPTTITPVWTGSSTGPSTTVTSPSPMVIPGNGVVTTITFTFNQSYDKPDSSEEILMYLSTPGCENYPLHQPH